MFDIVGGTFGGKIADIFIHTDVGIVVNEIDRSYGYFLG